MRLVLVALTVLIGSCAGQSPVSTPSIPATVKSQFENRIAETLLRDVRENLGRLEGAARVSFLREKSGLLNRSVDTSLLSNRLLLELRILEYLLASEDTLLHSGDYALRLTALSSLNWEPARYEQETLNELNRLDQTIAVLAEQQIPGTFSHAEHMSDARRSAQYPEDSFDGRQHYLDRLSQEMIRAQADWFDLYTAYNPSELAIIGEEGSIRTLNYSGDGLVINLDEVTDLPAFELKSIAVYYGFPGLQSFVPRNAGSLSAFLDLPAYTLGWAGYILDEVGTRDVADTLDYLYFARLNASLSLADLKLNDGSWSIDDAVAYVSGNTPYTRHRITLMIEQVQRSPGQYPAALAGKLKFAEINSRCRHEAGSCEAEFNQQVIDRGPIPFELLEQLIF